MRVILPSSNWFSRYCVYGDLRCRFPEMDLLTSPGIEPRNAKTRLSDARRSTRTEPANGCGLYHSVAVNSVLFFRVLR